MQKLVIENLGKRSELAQVCSADLQPGVLVPEERIPALISAQGRYAHSFAASLRQARELVV